MKYTSKERVGLMDGKSMREKRRSSSRFPVGFWQVEGEVKLRNAVREFRGAEKAIPHAKILTGIKLNI